MAHEAPLLRVQGLTIGRPEGAGFRFQVEDFSLTLAAGEKFALVGESGSGKTLTAGALVGLLPAPWSVTSGRIVFDGREIGPGDEAAWARLRGRSLLMLFQSPLKALNPVLKVGRQISETLIYHFGWDRTTARDRTGFLLAQVGIPPDQAHRYPGELSGGMRQRVLIALALGLRPRLLIADEPFTGLDSRRRGEVLDLLEQMRLEYGTALFVISHDLRLVSRWADRVAIMTSGRVVEAGPTADLLREPGQEYTRQLVRSLRTLEQALG
jgi:ABC-type glutathione transport system ATPase component